MGLLDSAVPIAELKQRQLWCVYGKSGTGKTEFISSFPKPMLYINVGDDGTNTIAGKDGIFVIKPEKIEDIKALLLELRSDQKYASVAIDMFSMVVNEWADQNVVQKKKRMTMQAWGDIKTDVEELIKYAQILSLDKVVVLSCHEVADAFDGMEDEITPEVRPNLNKGARSYFEGMCNFGIHTTIVEKEVTAKDGSTSTQSVFAAHLGPNPYYWTKTQKPKEIKLPKLVVNPTYGKILKYINKENV